MIIEIAAMSKNRVIGRDNGLPWNIPEDLQFFKNTTRGKPCIHGRKTFESLGRPLPARLNVVVSRQAQELERSAGRPAENAAEMERYRRGELKSGQKPTLLLFAPDLDAALEICSQHRSIYGDDVYVCGGAEIYRQALPRTDRILLTEIDAEFTGDTFFPEFSKDLFTLSRRDERQHGDLHYAFCVYDRKSGT